MNYFDASYLVRLYFEDPGWEAVRALAATVHVACCIHGQVEAVAAFHRKLREGALTPKSYRELRKQFDSDCAAGGFHWLPFSERLAARVVTVYAALPPSVHLRAADAVHLGCAAENALKEIYSNDGNLMAAANHFGLTAINVI